MGSLGDLRDMSPTSAYVSIRQHTPDVSIRQHTSAYAMSPTPAYASIRQHTPGCARRDSSGLPISDDPPSSGLPISDPPPSSGLHMSARPVGAYVDTATVTATVTSDNLSSRATTEHCLPDVRGMSPLSLSLCLGGVHHDSAGGVTRDMNHALRDFQDMTPLRDFRGMSPLRDFRGVSPLLDSRGLSPLHGLRANSPLHDLRAVSPLWSARQDAHTDTDTDTATDTDAHTQTQTQTSKTNSPVCARSVRAGGREVTPMAGTVDRPLSFRANSVSRDVTRLQLQDVV